MPVSVKNKSKKAGQEVVEKAPPLEEESAKKVDAFQSEMVGNNGCRLLSHSSSNILV